MLYRGISRENTPTQLLLEVSKVKATALWIRLAPNSNLEYTGVSRRHSPTAEALIFCLPLSFSMREFI